MDSGLSGEADQHLGDRSNHHQVRTEVILGSYWNMDWHSEVSMQGRLTSSSSMNSCRRYRADTADNEAVVAPSQSTVWPIVSADTDLPSQERSTKESRLTPISWSLARGSYWSSPDFSVFECQWPCATGDLALSVCSFAAAFLTPPASADSPQSWLQLLLTIT